MTTNGNSAIHPELQTLRFRLRGILNDIANFGPVIPRPPILDSSFDSSHEVSGDAMPSESVPGLPALRDAVKQDLDGLEKFLANPKNASLPPLSTNAPYLIAVWNEILLAPPPVTYIGRTYHDIEQPVPPHQRSSRKPPGVKVDVIAADGREWVRVNTIKNSRLLAEFREIDSYMTDSEDDSDDSSANHLPSLAPTVFDNSVLKVGRALVKAAKQNPLLGTNELPMITMRLTRLDPSPANKKEYDPRIAQTVQELQDMGMKVELGERDSSAISKRVAPRSARPSRLEPTIHINLDLSILIALVSDITHAPLPQSAAEADVRFVPPPQYREWKKKRLEAMKGADAAAEFESMQSEGGVGEHSRALANQTLQEMAKGLLEDMRDRLVPLGGRSERMPGTFPSVEFWTTPEARDRCLRIVLSRIGGPNEKRRTQALFPSSVSPPLSAEEAEESFWRDSRYPQGFVPLLPIHVFPSSEPDANPDLPSHAQGGSGDADGQVLSPFFRQLAETCREVLAQETEPSMCMSNRENEPRMRGPGTQAHRHIENDQEYVPRPTMTLVNPRVTAHTVQSMLWGAVCGWTTLTANKSSVKAIMRQIKATRVPGNSWWDSHTEDVDAEKAALWVVDPRSLAEGMRSDLPVELSAFQ